MEILSSLKKHQILDVLADSLCHHCEAQLQARITGLRKRKFYETSHFDDDDDDYYVSSRDASHMLGNGYASDTRRSHRKDDSPRNYFQTDDTLPRYFHRKRQHLIQKSDYELSNDGINGDFPFEEGELFEEHKEFIRYSQVSRRKNSIHIKRLQKEEDNPQRSFHSHESTSLMKHKRHATDTSPRYLNSKRLTLVKYDSKEEKECDRYSPDGRKKDSIHIARLEYTFSTKHNRHDITDSSPRYSNGKRQSSMQSGFELLLNDGLGGDSPFESDLSEEQKEHVRFSLVDRKKDFVHIERIDGRAVNVLQGLELHTGVFNVEEQRNIVKYVYKLQKMGRNGQLRARTYSEPRKWMRGKGRVTIQFGCCYNYAVDRFGNPPGIMRDEEVDPLPHLFKKMIKRMVKWHVLPPTCIPDSCIVNIYEEGDCIPPHIDHHDFIRPFSTVSFLSECDIVFGSNLRIVSPGKFQGPVPISLPVGSVFIFNGNGADIAKHCVPSVPAKRISITFRKMDDRKLPFMFSSDPELLGIKPLTYSPPNKDVTEHDNVKNSETQQQKRQSV